MDNWDYWLSLREKALRGGLWQDDHGLFDPVLRTLRGANTKAWLRRVFQPPFMESIYGSEMTEISLEVAGGQIVATAPRWVAVSLQAWAMITSRSTENVLKYLDSLPTAHTHDVEREEQNLSGQGEDPPSPEPSRKTTP